MLKQKLSALYFCVFATDCSTVTGPLPGVYYIQVDEYTAVKTLCLEGGWTVIQSRGQFENSADFFYKEWNEYKIGFGTPGKVMKFRYDHSSNTFVNS